MYVAELDRPWLDTPFVFQGFEIKDRNEIEQLQSSCAYVYVDIDRGRLTEAEIRSLLSSDFGKTMPVTSRASRDTPAKGLLTRIRTRLGRNNSVNSRRSKDANPYEISSTVRREAPRAKEAYEHTLSRYKSILDRARGFGEVSVDKVSHAVKPTIESILRNPDAMAWTVFSKKRSGRDYSRAVATSVWSVMFGRHLGFDRAGLHDLAIGGLLLDIGNIGVPGSIINADGSGYPKKKVGHHIPVYGRIAAVADCYDAMTTKTLYSPALAAYDSARELNDMRGKEFQAEVVGQFLQMIGMFPTGSVVEFSDGIVGVVLEQNRQNPLRPKVMLLKDSNGDPFDQPQILDMQKLPDGDRGSKAVSITKGHEHGAFGIDPLNYFA